jgi:aldehyde:ferredoxin oxidoreductase
LPVPGVTTAGYEGCGAGPEYETLGVFGPVCGVTFLPAVFKANYICNEMGIDTIDMGISISCAMELFELGYLSESEIGHKLNFGNYDGMLDLVQKTATREGFGNLLAEGGHRMAEHFGHPELFMGVKKQAMAMHHPQGCQNFGLAYATSNVGANHTKHVVNFTNRHETKGAAEMVKSGQDFMSVHDSIGLCNSVWNSPAVSKLDLPVFLEAALGVKMDYKEMCLIGERIWNLERLFNLKAGFTSKDDILPRKMLEHPLTRGASKGHVNRLHEMLPEYYQLRGWTKDGIPTPEKLIELGLEAEAAVVSGSGKGE